MKKKAFLFLITLILLLFPGQALAQDYYFNLEREVVHVIWNEDGTLTLDYTFVFANSPSGHAIEFVDVGLPNSQFNTSDITADVDGNPITFISTSEYMGSGSGVALGLEEFAIPPGGRGTVHVTIPGIQEVLHPDTEGDDYASAVFSPTWFGSEYVYGATDLTVTFHLPPGVEPEEPRWHSSPSGFPSSPTTSLDDQGRVTYTWRNPEASASTQYKFGASFPKEYVPASAISKPGLWESLGIDPDAVMGFLCMGGFFGFIFLIIVVSVRQSQKRKLKYLPPKMKIEGHGIKRGLTAIEAAILLEKPADKILTMILFSVVQKGAAKVISQEPLKIEPLSDPESKLRKYERQFLEAFQHRKDRKRKEALQDLMIDLIESVGEKMKGFSHRETVKYYRSIMEKAWKQVENADTPEVKSEQYNKNMGWTMLDKDFEGRTQEVFRRGPVYVPIWWHRYDPGFGRQARTSTSTPSGRSSGPSAGPALPNLPGGEFAASIVTGVQGFSSDVIGNITNFTNRITQETNPVPKSSSNWSSGSGGGGCACACACAGCACACAGGGR
jgi:hypothetical protein